MLELYQAYGNYDSMMDLTEAADRRRDSTPPASRLDAAVGREDRSTSRRRSHAQTYDELFAEHTGVAAATTRRRIAAAGRRRSGFRHGRQASRRGQERRLRGEGRRRPGRADLRDRLSGQHLPADQAEGRRTRRSPSGSSCSSTAWKLANAYTELNDPDLQEQLFTHAARRPAGRRLDGQDGPRFHPRPAARHAAGRRAGHRHRPAGDAADQHADRSAT